MAIGSYGLRPGLDADTVLRFGTMYKPVHAVIRTVDAPVTFDDAPTWATTSVWGWP